MQFVKLEEFDIMPEDGKREIKPEDKEFIFPITDYEAFAESMRNIKHQDRVRVLTAWAKFLRPRTESSAELGQDQILPILQKNNREKIPSHDSSADSEIILGEIHINNQTFLVFRKIRVFESVFNLDFFIRSKDTLVTVGEFNFFTDSYAPDMAENVHREINKKIRGYGVGKLLLSLSEQSVKQLGLSVVRCFSRLPASVLFFFANGYDLENIGEMTGKRLQAIAENNRNENDYFSTKDWILRKSVKEIPELK